VQRVEINDIKLGDLIYEEYYGRWAVILALEGGNALSNKHNVYIVANGPLDKYHIGNMFPYWGLSVQSKLFRLN